MCRKSWTFSTRCKLPKEINFKKIKKIFRKILVKMPTSSPIHMKKSSVAFLSALKTEYQHNRYFLSTTRKGKPQERTS